MKLDAFLDLYTVGMSREMADAVRDIWACWNGRYEINSAAWLNFFSFRESLTQHNKNWIRKLLKQDDLASSLVQFAENKL